MEWRNWSGRQSGKVKKLAFVRSEADAAALVRACAAEGQTLRVAGAGHSHSAAVLTDSVIADASGLSGVLDVDSGRQQAWIRAGSSIFSLGVQLHEHGLALKNQGDIDRQLLGGVIGTGTHGTGRKLQNIPAGVVALEVILASGEIVRCSPAEHPELFEVARLSVGSVGFITRVCMQLGASVVLAEQMETRAFEALIPDVPALVEQNERFEFFWYPGSDEASVKCINPVQAEPLYPLADEGARQAFSFEVLPSHRPHLHTEMEYSVPADRGLDCLAEIRALIQTDFPEVRWPVEYRTVAEDDLWLSMASGRPTVTISVHQDIRLDETDYYRACESVFLAYGGRPHWGKVNYLGPDQIAGLYPRWHDWWRVRDEYDPDAVFLNEYMRSLKP